MGNNWTDHVKRFARETGKSYGCALSDIQCSLSYKQKSPILSESTNSGGASAYIGKARFYKNKKESSERQAMRANDNPAPPTQKLKLKRKPKK